MIKSKRLALRLAAIVCASLLSCAATAASAWQSGATIMSVFPLADGSFLIGVVGSSTVCTNSAGSDAFYMHVAAGVNGVTATAAQNMFATSMTAYLGSKIVEIMYENSSSQCYLYGLVIHN